MTVGLLRAHVDERPVEPAELLAELNDHLQSSTSKNRFVAMAFCVYDPESTTLKLVNAGLPRPIHARGKSTDEIPIEGIPLGIFSGTAYSEETLTLKGGEAIVLYSDGLLEEENPAGEPFGIERVQAVISELLPGPAQEIADGLTRAVGEFSGDPARQRDDHTVVVLKHR